MPYFVVRIIAWENENNVEYRAVINKIRKHSWIRPFIQIHTKI